MFSVRIGALVALGLLVAGCGSAPAPATAPSAGPSGAATPVRVVASTNVYGSIVRAIGGDRVTVKSIIDSPDADPHEYEASPADAAAVAGARIMVVNGGGYDDFAGTLVEARSGQAAKPAVIDVVELSGLRAGQEEFNEHVWYSLPTAGKLADRLAADLAAADPAHAATYTANAAAFRGRLGELTAKVDAIRAAHAGDRVAVTEPVPLYLVQDAGLQNATPPEFSEAVEEGSDPSAAVLNDTLGLFTGKAVKALLANAQTESGSTRQVEQAATGVGIPVVTVTETLPAGVDDYVAWQGGQIDQLAAALNRPAA